MLGDKVMTHALRQAGIAALRHGFRSSFKDWARKHDVNELVSEFALAHVEGSGIVAILNRAAKIERLRARAAERMREFVPALFVRMFGDPARNPMGWQTACLGDVCDVQGGLQVTKKRAANPLEVPYLRVANVLRDEAGSWGDQVHEGNR